MSTATSSMPTELDPSNFTLYDDRPAKPKNNLAANLERFFDGEAPRTFTEPASPTDIGSLKCLPIELLEEIIYNLDLRSLENFRQANKHTLLLVESLPKYKAIFQYARLALRGILSIQTGAYIQFSDLYDEICCEACERCGLFGDYLYLLTFKRVCYFCIVEGDTYRPMELQSAKTKYGLTDEILRSVPSMKAVPKADPQGIEVETIAVKPCFPTQMPSWSRENIAPRKPLVDRVSALRAAVLLHGSHDGTQECGCRANINLILQFKQKEGLELSTRGTRPTPGGYIVGPTKKWIAMRLVAVVPVPWYNKETRKFEDGVYCTGCLNGNSVYDECRRRKFTLSQFKTHLEDYGEIVNGWHVKYPHPWRE